MPVPETDNVDISTLGLLQRILVTTDGTLTDMLAAAFLEPIHLVKLDVTTAVAPERLGSLDLDVGATVMRRKIVLRGERTRTNYVYAETQIATDRLAPRFRDDLITGNTPLGALWISHRLETWKERPRVRRRTAGELGRHLDVAADATLIERRYRTFTTGAPVFDVTEYFPLVYSGAAVGN